MRSIERIVVSALACVLCAFGFGTAARAGSHTWEVWEVFSNASGTVQFIEIKETNSDVSEWALHFHQMVSQPSADNYQILHDVTGNTSQRFYLFATSAFAALPGAPTPDEIIPANFIKSGDTSVNYFGGYGTAAAWTLGALPTDGIHSLNRSVHNGALSVATNSPTNYAGATGSVDASPALPGVPDGVSGTPLKVNKLAADGSSLSISWDTATCTDVNNHQILYGQRSGFPALAAGVYTLQGGTCSIGSTSPFTWTPTPAAGDGSGLTWFLLVTKGATGAEGPWGSYDGINERNGPGTGGSSNVCSTTSKSVAGTCGH